MPQNLEGIFQNGGFYDPIRYRDWQYPKVSRNSREGEQKTSVDDELATGETQPFLERGIELKATAPQNPSASELNDEFGDQKFDGLPARHFRPRYLCFLKDGPNGPGTEYKRHEVTDWLKDHDEASTDFVFISYTRVHFLVDAAIKWQKKPEPNEAKKAEHQKLADEDRKMVLAYGMEAARSANKRAFWVDFECIVDPDGVARANSRSEDIYRMSDIVRAAHSLVILIGPPHDIRLPGKKYQGSFDSATVTQWLRGWSGRLWTLPEILLCPHEPPVKLYVAGGPNPPKEIAKRNMAARSVWNDPKLVRQLIDHYESSIHLTPLELISIALECLSSRDTDKHSNGDLSYALMGLLRRRPVVDKSDSGFEAFARLSLANDSDKLLERLICMQPTHRSATWDIIRDAWGARLWDIEPHCQIAGIVDHQTVTLDGAFGATIQWDAMEQVAFIKRPTIRRLIGKILLRGVPGYFVFSLLLFISWAVQPDRWSLFLPLFIVGIIFLIFSIIIILLIPVMLRDIYQGKFWSTQAHFLGLEGIPSDIGKIEQLIFGFNSGRLKWSIAGSVLSRNGRSESGECIGLRPLVSDDSNQGAHQGETVFTLIDTYAMTATAFYAAKPPTTVIVCGREGGMQRAILCSYDWRKNTFVGESVIRIKTMVLDRMFRVDRFRFALGRRTDDPSGSAQQVCENPNDSTTNY